MVATASTEHSYWLALAFVASPVFHFDCIIDDGFAGVRYDLEMDALIGDIEGQRGCLYQPYAGHNCRPVTSGVMTFPDDVIEQQSIHAQWFAVFPVGGAHSSLVMSVGVGRIFESVCLSVYLFVSSITQKRMIPKCSNLV